MGKVMWVGIMQPYFFPYIGYFQLMAACDHFVLHDDVQYIKGGWVNRNRVLLRGQPQWITLPVASAPHDLAINQRHYQLDDRSIVRILRRLEEAYRKAPHFEATIGLVREVLSFRSTNVAEFNRHLLQRVAKQLGINTPIVAASKCDIRPSLAGEARVIEICRQLGGSGYINPIGGAALYRRAAFRDHDLELWLLSSEVVEYPQFEAPHVGSLSIVDVMMLNDPETVQRMLGQYRLIASEN